ncbi:MAG: DUF971 domain-containing protein [Hyphomicrobiaceae bacterium]|nr:DUF971 domain-containing protein [Hyphomicrobiaceae bacterium]
MEAAQGRRPKPPQLDVSADGRTLTVAFEDGSRHALAAELLRVMSPSAEVQGHSPEQRVTVARKRHVKIAKLEPVGNYAVKIFFDDGHNTGLYTWAYLDLLGREADERWAGYEAELKAKGLDRG